MERKQKVANLAFLCVVFALIAVCLGATNFKKGAISRIDNRYLAEFPSEWNDEATNAVNNYFQDRIGFREQMISFYANLNNQLFHVSPDAIWGKNGEFFGNGAAYIASYQHTDGDLEYADIFTNYLLDLQQLCSAKGIYFLYMQCPDKTTVYPEYMPDAIHVLNQQNLTEQIQEKVLEKEIGHVFCEEALQAQKTERVFFQKFDVAHWSDAGRFYGVNALLSEIQKVYPSVSPMDKEEFEISEVFAERQLVSPIFIREMLAAFHLKESPEFIEDTTFNASIQIATNTYYSRYLNPQNPNGPTLLMLCDSYMAGFQEYYLNRFSEVVQIHAYNAYRLPYFINLFEPDIVVFENVERVMTDFYPINYIATFSVIPPFQPEMTQQWEQTPANIHIAAINDQPVEDTVTMDTTVSIQKIVGGALNQDMQPEKMIYAKLNDKYYEPAYYQDGSFEFSFTNEQLQKSDKIEFLLVTESGTSAFPPQVYSITRR